METYISVLRGINVGGHKLIKMQTLRNIYTGLGFINVQTYVQSGNVVFQNEKSKHQDLENKIIKKISDEFTFEVPVIIIELEELAETVKSNPFINQKKMGIEGLHITFLSDEPQKVNIDKIVNGQYGLDQFIIIGRIVYLYCPNGYGRTKLTNNFFENKLKVIATTRNWKTVNELVNIGKDISTMKAKVQ